MATGLPPASGDAVFLDGNPVYTLTPVRPSDVGRMTVGSRVQGSGENEGRPRDLQVHDNSRAGGVGAQPLYGGAGGVGAQPLNGRAGGVGPQPLYGGAGGVGAQPLYSGAGGVGLPPLYGQRGQFFDDRLDNGRQMLSNQDDGKSLLNNLDTGACTNNYDDTQSAQNTGPSEQAESLVLQTSKLKVHDPNLAAPMEKFAPENNPKKTYTHSVNNMAARVATNLTMDTKQPGNRPTAQVTTPPNDPLTGVTTPPMAATTNDPATQGATPPDQNSPTEPKKSKKKKNRLAVKFPA